MHDIMLFNYNQQHQIRTTLIDGEPWFVAKDIADVLGIQNIRQNLDDLDADEKGVYKIYTPGGMQDMTVISESGLYALVLRSNKPEAKDFSRWVRKDVLPAIRKHGGYLTPQAQEDLITDPDFIIKLAEALKSERSKVKALQAQVDADRPKVIFADAVDASSNSILIGNLAKILCQNGIKMGQTRLFTWLRDNGYLMNCKGERWNLPTQYSIERGLFEVKKVVINNPDGSTKITHTTKVTGKGQVYFINLFLKDIFNHDNNI